MKKICVIGVGYVGLTTGTCFADLGNEVIGVDISEEKVEYLNNGGVPIYEPGLAEMIDRNRKAGRLKFTTSYEEALNGADFAFICVGTPEDVDGAADLKYVRAAAESIAKTMKHSVIIVNKSTVPVGTGDWVSNIVNETQPEAIDFSVVSCPEFLREGSAIQDFMQPDRTVLGSQNPDASEAVAQLFLPLRAPIVMTDLRTAEMIKYASNAFLATRISFINEISNICESVGADVTEVAQGMGFDHRIGHHFLQAGVGYGGSCFPKDVKALANIADQHGVHPRILNSVIGVNDYQRKRIMEKVREELGDELKGKRVALLGLAFKENTDDLRESPAIGIAEWLVKGGAEVYAYDPVAMENAKKELPTVNYCTNAYEAADKADALVIATPWNEFKQLDMKRILANMNTNILIDGRNMHDPDLMKDMGFRYRGVGRGLRGEGVTNGETLTMLNN